MIRIFVLIVAMALCAPATAQQWRLEVLGGSCQSTAAGDGIWWNGNYDHTLDLQGGCGLAAVSRITSGSGLRLAYVDMGRVHSDAVFPMVDAEQASRPDGTHCNPATFSGCLGRGTGTQTARGMSLGYVIEDSVGAALLGLEAGLFVYDSGWTVHVTSPGGTMDLHWRGVQATPYLGTTLRYGYLMAIARAYAGLKANEHDCGGCSGLTNGPAYQVLVGLSVPF